MRVKGYTRPLSVLQIKAAARKKYSSTAFSTMMDMLRPIGKKILKMYEILLTIRSTLYAPILAIDHIDHACTVHK